MSLEQNKTIVRQLIEGFFNTGDPNIAAKALADDYVDHSPSHPDLSGRENVKQSVAEWRTTFPDTVSEAQEVIAEGDKVAARWVTQATHQGEFMGVPPTRNHIYVTWSGTFVCPRVRLSKAGTPSTCWK